MECPHGYIFLHFYTNCSNIKNNYFSSVTKLFDPAGWLAAPLIIRAKILMQRMWLEGLEQDEEILLESLQILINLVQDLSYIEEMSTPRWIKYRPEDIIQILGFSDAFAYCATVMLGLQQTHMKYFLVIYQRNRRQPQFRQSVSHFCNLNRPFYWQILSIMFQNPYISLTRKHIC